MRNRFLLLIVCVFLVVPHSSRVSSQDLPTVSSLLIAPLKAHTTHLALLKGFQQVLIDELGRITAQPVTERLMIDKYLSEQGGATEPFAINHTDIPDLASHLGARDVFLLDFTEKSGAVAVKLTLCDGKTGNTVKTQSLKGTLGGFPTLKQNVVNAMLVALGYSGNVEMQKKATTGSQCLVDAVAALGKGLTFLDRGQPKDAASCFRRALDLDPSLTSAQQQLESLYKKTDDEILEPSDRGTIYARGGDYDRARSLFAEALEQNSSDIGAMVGMAHIYFSEKQLDRAAATLLSVLKFDENNLEALLLMAKVYGAQGKTTQIIPLIDKAMDLDSQATSVLIAAAEGYDAAQDKPKAVEYYLKAARAFMDELDLRACTACIERLKKLAPEDATAQLIEGDLKIALGDYHGAVKAYEAGKNLAPDNDELQQKLAFACQQIGDTQRARAGFEKALALNPKNVGATIGLGDLVRQERQYDQAIKYYSQAKTLDPTNTEARLKLAGTYDDANNPDAALDELTEALTASAGDKPVNLLQLHLLMGTIAKKQGKLKQAEKHLQKAVEIDPDNVSAYQALGMVKATMGKKEEAEKALALAKLLDPELELSSTAGAVAKKPDALQALNMEFLAFLDSFPSNPPNVVAPIVIERDVIKPSLFRRLVARAWFTYENRQILYEEFNRALAGQYSFTEPGVIQTIFAKQPYSRMVLKDIDDDDYMSMLCNALGGDALFFYRVEKLDPPEDKRTYRLHAYLFDKTKKRWTGKVAFFYPPEALSRINWPFTIVFLALLAAGLTYGAIYLYRGFGNLQVLIARDVKTSAFFSIKVSKKPNLDLTKMKRSLKEGLEHKAYSRKARFSRHTEKYLVEKDCVFKNLSVGHYYVYLYGIMIDQMERQIGNYQVTKEVDVQKGKTAKLEFDLMPKTAYVTVEVYDADAIAVGAEVEVKGKPGVKYLKNEEGVYFELEPGEHTLIIHYHNKKFSKKISITSINNHDFRINLAGKT